MKDCPFITRYSKRPKKEAQGCERCSQVLLGEPSRARTHPQVILQTWPLRPPRMTSAFQDPGVCAVSDVHSPAFPRGAAPGSRCDTRVGCGQQLGPTPESWPAWTAPTSGLWDGPQAPVKQAPERRAPNVPSVCVSNRIATLPLCRWNSKPPTTLPFKHGEKAGNRALDTY